MGCDIHAVLQKKNDSGSWDTLLVDVLGQRNYTLFSELSGVRGIPCRAQIATDGLPDDFAFNQTNQMHGNFWMGDHSFGHCTLEEFVNHQLPDCLPPAHNFHMSRDGNTVTLEFEDPEEYDRYHHLKAVQMGLDTFFGDYNLADYRLVFGYDS